MLPFGILGRLTVRVFKLVDDLVMKLSFLGSGSSGDFNGFVPLSSFFLEGLFADRHCLMKAEETEKALNK